MCNNIQFINAMTVQLITTLLKITFVLYRDGLFLNVTATRIDKWQMKIL